MFVYYLHKLRKNMLFNFHTSSRLLEQVHIAGERQRQPSVVEHLAVGAHLHVTVLLQHHILYVDCIRAYQMRAGVGVW